MFKNLAKRIFARKIYRYIIIGVILGVLVCVAWVAISTFPDPLQNKLKREQVFTEHKVVTDVTELYPIQTQGIIVPHTIAEIVSAVQSHDHVSIGGGRNSMGGQTASTRAVQIDMRKYNHVLDFSTTTKEITVQAGMRWYDLQKFIDPYDLSVTVMQTYSNFTVGGSLSVNVHGRYIGKGPIVTSVKSFHIVLADGSMVNASPVEHPDIFYSAIGGLGGIGVITDATLQLSDNVNVERSRKIMPVADYARFFSGTVRSDPNVIFHNADLYPPDFRQVSAVSWSKTDKKPTTSDRLIPHPKDYWLDRSAWVVMSEWPNGRWIREHVIDPLVYSGTSPVHTRNYEASYDIAELEPESRSASTYVLQEYFVPVENFDAWIPKMKKVFDDYGVNLINVSIRHANQDPGTMLAWARHESFAFVVYYKQGTDEAAKQKVGYWTRAMIDQVLSVGGTYYLPYQPLATEQQFHRAYPGADSYFETKKKYDPSDKFTNSVWDIYYSAEKLARDEEKQKELSIASSTADYYRKASQGILSLPEWYIVYAADQYAATLTGSLPSHFPYALANTEYWREYRYSLNTLATTTDDIQSGKTVLRVIGASFTVENMLKGAYENSIGKTTEWLAKDTHVPEDDYAAKVATDYASFIYDHPWYDFDFQTSFSELWSLQGGGHYSAGEWVRRVERKIYLSLEYGIKTLYASCIAYATHQAFGVQDDVVYAVITEDGGTTYSLIHAPHYQPFTRLLLDTLTSHQGNDLFSIIDIAGNDTIVITYMTPVGQLAVTNAHELLREKEIISAHNSTATYADRITAEVKVKDLTYVYKTLASQGSVIDHVYDF